MHNKTLTANQDPQDFEEFSRRHNVSSTLIINIMVLFVGVDANIVVV